MGYNEGYEPWVEENGPSLTLRQFAVEVTNVTGMYFTLINSCLRMALIMGPSIL